VKGNRNTPDNRLTRMRRVALGVTLATILAACGAPPGDGTADSRIPNPTTTSTVPTTVPPPETISEGELGVIVPPDDGGNYPPDLVVTCGYGQFPISALADIRPLEEADPGGVAAAIEPFLSSEEGQYWPQEGWQVLHLTDREVLLVVKEEGSLTFMSASNDGTGWTWSGSGGGGEECPLEFMFPEDLNAVTWMLDPDGAPLTTDTTELEVILNERPCVDGREIGDRLLPPEIVMTETQVFMAFAAERPPGDAFTCPGNPDTPYVVELPEPLGDRDLVEGVQIGVDLADYVD